MGLDASQYSGRSFPRGGAQFALQCGLSTELIKLQGDWRSNACERYLEPSFELRKQVSETMGAFTGCSFILLILGSRSYYVEVDLPVAIVV